MRSSVYAFLLALVMIVSFAVPSAVAQSPAPVPHKSVGIGIEGDDNGVQISVVVPGSPAEKAGVKVGDQVVSIAGIPILDFADEDRLHAIADTAKVLPIVVMRGGEKLTLNVQPAFMQPPPAPATGTPPR